MDEFTYGQYIKSLRKDLNLTRKEACEELSISVQTLTRIEGDKVSISLDVLEELTHLFKIDVSAFLNKEIYLTKNLIANNKFNKETIGKTLIFLRNREQMSQNELALKIGVSNNKISLWENNKSAPNVIEFKNLCDALNADPDEFYFNKIIPEKRIVKLFENPSEKFIKIFSTVALGVILCGIGNFNISSYDDPITILPPEGMINPDDGLIDTPPIVPPRKYKVTYRYEMIDDVVVKEFAEGSKVPFLPLPVAVNGYKLVDYTYKNKTFDFENYRISENLTLYGDLEKVTYTVNYYAGDNETIIKSEEVPYLEKSTPPNPELVDVFEEKRFLRWSQKANKVTSDLDIYPIYTYFETDLTFIDVNGAIYDPIKDYSHSLYTLLPKPMSSYSSTFIGWFYNDKPFNVETPLEKEMTLVSKYLPEDVVHCYTKTKNDGEYYLNHYVAGYNLQFLSSFTDGNMLATRFNRDGKLLEYPVVFDDNNIYLEPIFDIYIEYEYDEDRNIIINELRSESSEVYIPNTINDVNVGRIKKEALILPNCTKLVIGAGNITFEEDAFLHCEQVEELYIKDYKTWDEKIYMPQNLLSPLKNLRTLELPLGIYYDDEPININTIGINEEVNTLSLRFDNDFNFNEFFKKAEQRLLDKITFITAESINDYPFNRRIQMDMVDLSKFNNLKKLDFIGTINEIHLYNASKSKATITYNGELTDLYLYKDLDDEKVVIDKFQILNKKTVSLVGNEKIYAKKIKLDTLALLNFYDDFELYPLDEIYLPEFYKIHSQNELPRIKNLVKGNVVDVYIKGDIPSEEELNKLFKGASSNLFESFNFISF